ncbi:MAG: DUF3618 domain-containing protein [Pseudomonadota bacterium]
MAYSNDTHSGLDRDPERIENEIESTRSRIEARLDALTQEFSPSTLMDRALGVNEAHPDQDTFGLMVERARSNPFSAAMIAAGLAGMVLNKPAARPVTSSDEHHPIEPYSADPAERIGHHIDTLETQANALSESAKSTASGVADTVSSAFSGAVDTVTGAVSSARAKVSSSADEASRGYEQTRRDAIARGRDLRESAREAPAQAKASAGLAADWVRANPLPAGLFALAAGATIASVFAAQNTNSPRARARAAEELYDSAQDDVVKRKARRASVATAVAKAPKPTAKPRVKAAPKTRKPAAAKTASTARKQKVSKAMPKTATLGKNLDRSVAVQGKATSKST